MSTCLPAFNLLPGFKCSAQLGICKAKFQTPLQCQPIKFQLKPC